MSLLQLLCFLPIVLTASQNCNKGSQADMDILLGELTSYSEYVYKRYMETERSICYGINGFSEGQIANIFEDDVKRKMGNLENRLVVVVKRSLHKYPPALSCARQVYQTLDDQISEAVTDVNECVKRTKLKFTRLQTNVNRDYEEFLDLEEAGLNGIQQCFKVYTNCQKEKRDQCAKTSKDIFFSKGKTIAEKHFASPCTQVFKEVAGCIDESAKTIDVAVDGYLDSLFQCAETIPDSKLKTNIAALKPEKNSFALNSKLATQIEEVRTRYLELNNEIERTLLDYHNQEVAANKTYLFEPKSEEKLGEPIEKMLGRYKTAVLSAQCISTSNKHQECVSTAGLTISDIENRFVNAATLCNQVMVATARQSIEIIRDKLKILVQNLSFLGNWAMLNCVTEGLIFKTDLVKECFDNSLRGFDLEIKTKTLEDVNSTVEQLQKYNKTYFSLEKTPMLCKPLEVESMKLEADWALYELGRCVYANTGYDHKFVPTDINICERNPDTTSVHSTEAPKTPQSTTTSQIAPSRIDSKPQKTPVAANARKHVRKSSPLIGQKGNSN